MDFGLDIKGLLRGYKAGEFKPSEVVESYLEAIEQQNLSLHAFLEIKPELSLEKAKILDSRMKEAENLPLFGVPIAVKDNFLVLGWGATAGSKMLENYRSPYTATCVERLEAAGAIIIGKTNLDEFAMGSSNETSAYVPARNPWDIDRVPGGSSGGSAAAMASGCCLGALGTDTGGSIRQPASFCGVVGIKPTYGRVSRYGVIAFASSLDQVGSFGRTVWDAARVLEQMAGHDQYDATSSQRGVSNYTKRLDHVRPIRGLRVGVAKEWLAEGLEDELKGLFDHTLLMLKSLGAELVDISLPHTQYALSTYYLIAPSEASSNLARYDGVHYGHRVEDPKDDLDLYARSRGEGFGPEVKLRIMLGTYALSSGYYDAYYLKANQVRQLIQKDFQGAFEKCDLIAAPTSPSTAFRFGERADDPIQMYLSDVFTLPINLAGVPAVSIPCSLDRQNLPIGLQLIGQHFAEPKLLDVAHQFEKLRGPFPRPLHFGVGA